MINIIHVNVHFDDNEQITALELKLKALPQEKVNESVQHLVARASAAFLSTPLLSDEGESLKTTLNPKRKNVVNLLIKFREGNNLSLKEIADFVEEYKASLSASPF